MKEWASALFASPEWRASATKRIIAGKAPHLEAHCMQVLLPKTDKQQHQVVALKPVITFTSTPEGEGPPLKSEGFRNQWRGPCSVTRRRFE